MKTGRGIVTIRALILLASCGLMTGAVLARGASQPIYDTQADAHREIAAAKARALKSGRNIVLVFGANW